MQVTLAETSDWGPALTVFNNQLILGWTGSGNNYLNLMTSSDGGQTWGPVTTIASQTANGAPTFAVLGNVLYIAWAGTGSNHYLNVMQTSDLKTFPSQLTIEKSAHPQAARL